MREQRFRKRVAVAVRVTIHIQTHIVKGLRGEAADKDVVGRGGHRLPVPLTLENWKLCGAIQLLWPTSMVKSSI